MGEFIYLSIMTANGKLTFDVVEGTSLVKFNAVSVNVTKTYVHTTL